MGEHSKIEWTDHTFNPWIGCTKVAEGCKHCYAEALAKRTASAKWGPEGTRVVTSDANWKQPLKWNREAEQAGVRAKVFCASMADVFEDWQGAVSQYKGHPLWIHQETSEWVEFRDAFPTTQFRRLTLDDVRKRLFKLIDQTPNLDWLLLTKRPENIGRMWPCVRDTDGDGNCKICFRSKVCPRRNLWLGTSISTTRDMVRNVHLLTDCRELSPVLFLSMEPLLERIDLYNEYPSETGVDWVIVGGESGPGARPMEQAWVEKIQRDCADMNYTFFFKQWGGVDKKKTGHILNGDVYQQFPQLHMNQPWKGN